MTPAVAGILLTGGASRRLGIDKATLVCDGETLAVRAARLLASVCTEVVEVGPGHSGRRAVSEEPAGAGPLAAFAAGSAAVGGDGPVLLLAVDLPAVTVPLLRLLATRPGAATAVPDAGGRLQPVCARYGPEARRAAPALLGTGARSLHALLERVEHDVVAEAEWQAVAPADAFADVDTPTDVARFGLAPPGSLD